MTLQEIIDDSKRIVFFGGAGVSTESGIPDFRSEDGLYHQQFKYPPEQMLSYSFYKSHPAEFYRFYREKMIAIGYKPNAAHYKLAELEKAGKLSAVITQNIDGLHSDAGSKNVIEIHGTVRKNYCENCGRQYSVEAIVRTRGIPTCACGGRIKPGIVLYEEPLDENALRRSIEEVSQADTLIVGGTSLVVYPAAGLLGYFKGKHLVIINRSETAADEQAELVINDSIGETLSKIKVN